MPERRPDDSPVRMDIFTDPTQVDQTLDGSLRQPQLPPKPAISEPDRFPQTKRFTEPQLIGAGGMGLVYRVLDGETGQHVALKTLRTLDPEEMYRLKQEFRTLANVIHQNLVELYELFATGDDCYVTMELLDGVDFVRWVRAEELPQEELTSRAPLSLEGQTRLRLALAQLEQGLAAVHGANRLHRDIKPSNVLVTREGRVVILDFGLVTQLVEGRTARGAIAGTPVYMSPEQARGEPLTPATDWYSVGVMLYECLTGRRPHENLGLRDIQTRTELPTEPRKLDPNLPNDLNMLTMKLLEPQVRDRAGPEQVRPVATGVAQPMALAQPSGVLQMDVPETFVGRAAEMAELWSAWNRVDTGRPAIVHLSGPSGMGKSELLQHFLHELEETEGALTLVGRCHPQETVPYKAMDAVIDALQHFLSRQREERMRRYVPPDLPALLRVFPALRGVGMLAEHAQPMEHGLEPHEIRRRAFASLRSIFFQLAEATPLVIAIDDLHWGDLDSAMLLRELLRPPKPPGLLLILAWRREEEAHNPVVKAIREEDDIPQSWVTRLELRPLEQIALVELAESILRRFPAQVDPQELAAEASGSPFFLGQLVRYHAAPHAVTSGAVNLAEVVAARLGQLDVNARRLLEVVAVAGRPLQQRCALQAAGLGESGRLLVSRLQQAGLLRATALHDATALEAYHHRIREAIVEKMPDVELVRHHQKLAEVLADLPGVDPEELVAHYIGARDPVKASAVARQAAERSLDTLAFDHAARLYQQALALGVPDGERPHALTRLAESLALAGRGAESAKAFVAAAEESEARSARTAQVLTLRRRAGEQFLHSGRFQEGQTMMASVLHTLGLLLPPTPAAAMRQMLWGRLRILLRGLKFTERTDADVAPNALVELDALWGASTSMAMVNHLVADALGVTHFLRAMTLGERSRVCRALGYEAAFEATLGLPILRKRLDRMLNRMATLAEKTENPYDSAWFSMSSATCAWFRCEWQEVIDHADVANVTFRQRCRGADWEIAVLQSYALSALANRGQMRDLQGRIEEAMRDAEDRGDLFALANCVIGMPTLGWLAADRPGFLREQANGILAQLPPQSFLTQHYHYILAMTQADLYTADLEQAHQRMTESWPRLESGHFLQLAYIRDELRHLRGRTALALAVQDPRRRPQLVQEVNKLAQQLGRSQSRVARPFRALLQAGVAALAGEKMPAVRLLGEAKNQLQDAGMELYALCVDRQLAILQDLPLEMANGKLREAAVMEPAKMAAVLTPGFE